MPAPITADTLTVDMVHEYFPGAFADPVTVPLDLQLKCYRAVGCLQTDPALRQEALEYLANLITGMLATGIRLQFRIP